MAPLDLLVLGDCNPDLVVSGGDIELAFGQVERIVERAELTIGGSGAITSCAAARLGLGTALSAVVGDDLFGRFMIDALTARDVDVSAVVVDPTRPTGATVVFVRGEDRAILTALGTIDALAADLVDRALLHSARHVHVSSFFLQHRLRPGLASLLEEARAAGASTSIDPNWDPREEWAGGLLDLLPMVDVLLLNLEEARRIAREDEAEAAARVLAERGPVAVVKLGAEGALSVERGRAARASVRVSSDVVDTVGAGDSFDAGFLAGVLGGKSVDESLALAVACGSLSTRAAGGTGAQPSLDEAEAWT